MRSRRTSVASRVLSIERTIDDAVRTWEGLKQQVRDLREVLEREEPAEVPRELPSATSPPVPPALLRIGQVTSRVGLSKSTIWKLSAEREFPQPRRLGPRSVAWLASEVDAWILSRPRQ